METVDALCVRMSPNKTYALTVEFVGPYLFQQREGCAYLCRINISPPFETGAGDVALAICKVLAIPGEQFVKNILCDSEQMRPALRRVQVLSLICTRKFLLGEVTPMNLTTDGVVELNLGAFLSTLAGNDYVDKLRNALPGGESLMDWCTLDALCWLLKWYHDNPAPLSVAASEFLKAGEKSFPYSPGLIDEVFRDLIGAGVGTDRSTRAGPELGFDGRHRSLATQKRDSLAERLLSKGKPSAQAAASMSPSGNKCDVFICHATEDKAAFVESLAHALDAAGVSVFYDKFSIEWGDSLREKIDEGLRTCRYGIVVLSRAFFEKEWPQYELDGLAERQMAEGRTVILPVWHQVTKAEIMRFSPPLAGRVAVMSSEGVANIVTRVQKMLAQREEGPASKGSDSRGLGVPQQEQ